MFSQDWLNYGVAGGAAAEPSLALGKSSLPVHDVEGLSSGTAVPKAIGMGFQLAGDLAPLAAKSWPEPHIWQRIHAPLHQFRVSVSLHSC